MHAALFVTKTRPGSSSTPAHQRVQLWVVTRGHIQEQVQPRPSCSEVLTDPSAASLFASKASTFLSVIALCPQGERGLTMSSKFSSSQSRQRSVHSEGLHAFSIVTGSNSGGVLHVSVQVSLETRIEHPQHEKWDSHRTQSLN